MKLHDTRPPGVLTSMRLIRHNLARGFQWRLLTADPALAAGEVLFAEAIFNDGRSAVCIEHTVIGKQ